MPALCFRYLANTTEEFHLWGVNAHATSTPKGDKAEMLAISKFLQSSRLPPNLQIGDRVSVTSHKGNFGHLLGGAGSTEAVFVALALKNGVIPAIANTTDLDDFQGQDPRYT